MKRRGIGNVIATAIMVFLLIFTISQLYIYSFDQLDDYNRVAAQVLNTIGQKGNERISITNAELDVSGATTNVTLTITNPGGTTAHIVDVWMDSVTESTRQHQHCYKGGSCGWSAELYVGSGLSLTMPTLDSNMPTNHIIAVKVFTELGVSTSVQLLPPSLAGTSSLTLAATSVTLVPTNPITSNTMTVVLTVSNNNQLGVAFTSLSPDICLVQGSNEPLVSTTESGTLTLSTGTTIEDTPKIWGTDVWAKHVVVITSGNGVAQSRTISTNTANTLTVSPAWTTNPSAGDSYVIQNNCHSNAPAVESGTTSSATPTTLTNSSKSWTTDQWKDDTLVILSGTGAGQSRTISSNTDTQLTVSSAWTITPAAGAKFAIRGALCNDDSGTTAAPAQCTLGQSATPSSLSFLPFGSTVVFQWGYLVESTLPDAPITVVASYVNLTTTSGLLSSQVPAQTATVRGVGGGSVETGGNIASALGSFQNIYQDFRMLARSSTSDVGPWIDSQWSSSLSVDKDSYLVMRVNVTNGGQYSIALSSKSFISAQRLSSASFSSFYLVYFNNSTDRIVTYGGANTVTVDPGETVSLYFAVKTQGGDPSQSGQAEKLGNTDNYIFMIILNGTRQSTPTTEYGQAVPFVVVEATA